jgi:glycosyltransferase involved in cell wall biosynthesis
MDILFASEALLPAVGGAERTMLEWADGLRRRGHTVRTVCLAPAPRPAPERYWRWRSRQREQLGSLAAAAIAERAPEVVVAQLHGAPTALAAATRAGIPGVLAIPSYEALCKVAFVPGSDCPPDGDCVSCPAAARLAPAERAALAAGRSAHDATLSTVQALVTPSAAMARTVRQWTGREATVVWPVGPELPAWAETSPHGRVVCAAARWSAHKGAALLPALVAAARTTRHHGARVVHVTEAGLGANEREAIGARGGTLIATAPIGELVAGASLVLVPSQWEEPFGRIAWEALARGVPVLASDAGGLAECVPAAMRVSRRDRPPAWASAIDRLLCDPDAWRSAAAAARPHAATLLKPPPLDRLEQLLTAAAETHG